jgi:hypothetical protein
LDVNLEGKLLTNQKSRSYSVEISEILHWQAVMC